MDLPSEADRSVYERYKNGEVYDYVVTLCHEAAKEQCPLFKTSVDTLYAKNAERLSWHILDFNSISGSAEEQKSEARKIRDLIKTKVIAFLSQIEGSDRSRA